MSDAKLLQCRNELLQEIQNSKDILPDFIIQFAKKLTNAIVNAKQIQQLDNVMKTASILDMSFSSRVFGLKNLGNTCYMNSAIQCLVHTNQLTQYIVNMQQKAADQQSLSQIYCHFLKNAQKNNKNESLQKLKSSKQMQKKKFSNKEQHDSVEFILYYLDYLHNALNRIKIKQQLNFEPKQTTIFKKAMQRWIHKQKSNSSIIHDLFAGQQISEIKCEKCSKSQQSFEIFLKLDIPIHISPNQQIKLSDCFAKYIETQKLNMKCNFCQKQTSQSRRIKIFKPPKYMIVVISRFKQKQQKNQKLVVFERTIDIENYIQKKNIDKQVKKELKNYEQKLKYVEQCEVIPLYQLYGIINHFGTPKGGHYTSAIKNKNKWYEINDQTVTETSFQKLVTPNAYVLFYKRLH